MSAEWDGRQYRAVCDRGHTQRTERRSAGVPLDRVKLTVIATAFACVHPLRSPRNSRPSSEGNSGCTSGPQAVKLTVIASAFACVHPLRSPLTLACVPLRTGSAESSAVNAFAGALLCCVPVVLYPPALRLGFVTSMMMTAILRAWSAVSCCSSRRRSSSGVLGRLPCGWRRAGLSGSACHRTRKMP